MTHPSRQIALHVEEPHDGEYLWCLTERSEANRWPEIERSSQAAKTFKKALADGVVALERLVEDAGEGPGHTARKEPSGRTPDSKSKSAKPSKTDGVDRPKTSPFGFGPVR